LNSSRARWDNVDIRHGFILLDRTKNGERREIPINKTLEALFLDRNLIRLLYVPYVFFDLHTGKQYQDVKRSFETALRKAGTRDFHFHDLSTPLHLTWLCWGKRDDSKGTIRPQDTNHDLRYAHLAPSHKIKAVDIPDNTLNGKPTIQKLYNSEAVNLV